VQEIETLLGRQAVADLDLEALELAVRQQVLQLAGAAVEQRLNADTSDERGARTGCRCGQEARLVGRRSKQVQSVLGPLQLERAYYHCSSCGHGFCPRDGQLGIENTSLSPALTRMVGTVGAMVSFQEGSELLTELAGVAVDAKQVERTAEALGKQIAEDERHCTESADALPLPQTLYLGMDGTGIPLRAEELVDRTGKQPDGSAKTGEVKLCTIWSAESLDEEGTSHPRCRIGHLFRGLGECLYGGYRCDTFSLCPTRLERSYAPPLLPGAPYGGARGWGPVDLEYCRRSVSRGHPDCGPLSCQTTLE
jgi:hypothetical protein